MPDLDAVAHAINDELPAMARAVIRRHLNLGTAANRHFLQEPDAREQHQVYWHQWGIITHTRVFLHDFDTVVPRYLRDWGLWERVDAVLRQSIDGVSRWQLLRIAILLHDLGKFGTRTQGKGRFHFIRHEELSGEIIRNEIDLARFGLTPSQIDYIALVAADHFVLGILRNHARQEGNYDLTFVRSERFFDLACDIKVEHPEDFVEIGVLFLGDSLAKAHPPEGPERALSQYEINIAVAHRYLDVVLDQAKQ